MLLSLTHNERFYIVLNAFLFSHVFSVFWRFIYFFSNVFISMIIKFHDVSIWVPAIKNYNEIADWYGGPKFSPIHPPVPGTCRNVRTTSSSSNKAQISAAAAALSLLRLDWSRIESERLIIERLGDGGRRFGRRAATAANKADYGTVWAGQHAATIDALSVETSRPSFRYGRCNDSVYPYFSIYRTRRHDFTNWHAAMLF